ncbi:sulfurtransferase [Marinomonas posidonica]|uniref:3-mercaptopyruvate sulfurtransferase n=1 Tax=Marinomonas posidonica (strain CECT 7376 / NCIMB 14433 / IVIA-Po-181) TaxID=491952 RepID=F6CRR1_MARPP|nr:sulfurtransferase [Marinomonas posidonica]AEF53824.1 3-mercaptopyruvate sulfurtransferase [Marinomonas posidonica IVIA-Po-181]
MIPTTLITTEELESLLDSPNLVLLDCRFYLTDLAKGNLLYQEGHLPNAIFVDVHHQLAAAESETSGRHPLPSEQIFSNQLQLWGIDKQSDVVIYDDMGGAIAARAWWMMVQQGLKVRVLDGGYPAWLREDKEVSCQQFTGTKTNEVIDVVFPWAVDEQSIVENFETNQFQLVDARAADRFEGENETMDPVAGHIPGAINRPFMDNLDELGYFKPAEQLHVEWQDWISQEEEAHVYYCGSGVTACHNVLALNYSGIEAQRVYVGSWSQWAKRMLRLTKAH